MTKKSSKFVNIIKGQIKMNRTKYTEEEIKAENKAREELAYTQIKEYIIKQQNRFIGACGYNFKRIVYQCTKHNNKYLNNDKSNLIKYLTIPTQILKKLAGHYVHTSRQSLKRIPVSPIIERLKKEKVLDTISYNADNHRAICYVLPVNHKAIVLERINALQKKNNQNIKTTQVITKSETIKSTESKSSIQANSNYMKKFNELEFDKMKKYLIQAYINDLITYNDIIRFTKIIGIEKINIQDNNKSNRNIKVYNQIYDVLKSRGYNMTGISRL